MYERYFVELQNICVTSGFSQKGKAFFRVWGDGVLQVIQCRYERAFRSDLLCVGLLSMYGPLQPKCFTATGCMAKYSIVNCFEQNDLAQICAPSLQVQTDMLRSRVMPWLNTIDTQKKLITAINKLDCRWNDIVKVGAYLACGEHNHAKKVIKEIIGAHSFAMVRKSPVKEGSINDMLAKVVKEENPLFGIIEIIDMGDTAIRAYIQINYETNMQHAKFCVGKIQASPDLI